MTAIPTSIGRDLALEARVRDLAGITALWQPLVRFTSPRLKIRLDIGTDVEAWLLTWAPGQGTGLHDHGGSSGCLTVLQGTLWESVADGSPALREFIYRVGDVRSFDEHLIHDVHNDGSVGAVSLHVYRPQLTSMTHYSTANGSVEAVSTQFAGIDW